MGATCIVPGTPGAQVEPDDRAAAERPAAMCSGRDEAKPLRYRNSRVGLTMTYPSNFALDLDSIPPSGDTARFRTADQQATAVVTGLRNGLMQTIPDLLAEAKRDVTENSGGIITYTRVRDDWFVLSGYMAGRIFYRRTLLAQGHRTIGTLWVEFPRAMKPCFEDAVTMMSLSFRPAAE